MNMPDVESIELIVKALAFWGLSGWVAFIVMEQIAPYLKERLWNDFHLRWFSYGLSALIALSAWSLGLWLQFFAPPIDTAQAWFISIAAVIGMSTGASQFIHGWVVKRGQSERPSVEEIAEPETH